MPQRGRRNADQRLLMALACGATNEKAAASAGISEATVYRRLKDAEFQQEVRKTGAEMVGRTKSMLTASFGEAVKALLTLLKDSTPAATSLGAARAIIELGVRLRESSEMEERIAALEARIAETK